jgi:ceramide glucosyltransferase
MTVLGLMGWGAGIIAAAGCVQSMLGAALVMGFRRREKVWRSPVSDDLPPISVLKPLHGAEPMLEQALRSFVEQDYPAYQIVFGVQHEDDAAIEVVHALQAHYPDRDLTLVIDRQQHGVNRKVGNLINMIGMARHEMLVISDSDIHVGHDYLRHIAASLADPQTGLVTTLYAGLPATETIVRRLSACQINHNFLPGVLLSRHLGRQDCLGATMALRRKTLEQIGGLRALVDHVADDAILGTAVRGLGLDIAIAPCMTWTTIGERTMRDLLAHELRWGRTVKNVEPFGYALSSIQLPLFWATAAVAFLPHSTAIWILFAVVWTLRAVFSLMLDRSLGLPSLATLPLLPFRDWMSAAVMVGSARGTQVAWRGQTMHIMRHSAMSQPSQPLGPGE